MQDAMPVIPGPATVPAIDDPAGRAQVNSTTSTQTQYPLRAVKRTIFANIVALLPIISGGIAYLSTSANGHLPSNWVAWLSGAAVVSASLSGAVTRVLAMPAVDALLAKFGLSSQP